MMGWLATVVLIPIVGLAASRLLGRFHCYLAGAGITGLVLFTAGVLHVPLKAAYVALIVASVITLMATRRQAAERFSFPLLPTVLALVPTVWLLVTTAIIPLSDYDGRAFWMLKAKAIAHEERIDGPFFQQRTTSTPRNEYPLLLPILAAVSMELSGELDDRPARWLFVLMLVSFAWEVRTRFAAWFSPAIGAWLAAVLLWLPQLLIDGAGGAMSAYSDIALGAFVAGALFELIEPRSPLRFGFWLAFVALTKSEGLPLAALLLVLGVITFRRRVLMALPPLITAVTALFVWRSRIARSDEQDFARQIFDLPDHASRFLASLGALAGQVVAIHDWGLFWLAVVLGATLLTFRRASRAIALPVAVIAPMVGLYAAVYAVSGWEISGLTRELAPRVLTHLLGPAAYILGASLQRLSVHELAPVPDVVRQDVLPETVG